MASTCLTFPSVGTPFEIQKSSPKYAAIRHRRHRPIWASISEKPLVPVPPATSKVSAPIRKIPGDYGLPLVGPLKDRLDYFYNQGRNEFFKSRILKHQSTVFRVNMPPGPFIAQNPRVVVLLDGKSFPVLFDVSKVEKKDLFLGTFMPSTELTGGYRVLSYLDPSEPVRVIVFVILLKYDSFFKI